MARSDPDQRVVAGRVGLQLQHQVVALGLEQLDVCVAHRLQDVDVGQRDGRVELAAVRLKRAVTRSKPRSTAARNRSRLLANRLNTYGCATPTRRAILSTGVPCRPPWANSCTAASISASRRSEAGTR